MSVPKLTLEVWNEIKDAECIGWVEEKNPYLGQWGWFITAEGIKVLYNSGGTWELIAWEEDPPKPPQGTMNPADFEHIRGGRLKPRINAISKDGSLWQIIHEEGSLGVAGLAIPVQVA